MPQPRLAFTPLKLVSPPTKPSSTSSTPWPPKPPSCWPRVAHKVKQLYAVSPVAAALIEDLVDSILSKLS